ncbi:hypothetical protein PIB30_047799 [Stylosanthes scabra]|uniref:Uncharacterized protein n=1 Tax=Stylosanthes scabra TaxID=79078 RepID=A0ABU6WF62_9FABA|nr:hypothetical protein [Stylosanthes scabra]
MAMITATTPLIMADLRREQNPHCPSQAAYLQCDQRPFYVHLNKAQRKTGHWNLQEGSNFLCLSTNLNMNFSSSSIHYRTTPMVRASSLPVPNGGLWGCLGSSGGGGFDGDAFEGGGGGFGEIIGGVGEVGGVVRKRTLEGISKER